MTMTGETWVELSREQGCKNTLSGASISISFGIDGHDVVFQFEYTLEVFPTTWAAMHV
jgi:hypothetical protein